MRDVGVLSICALTILMTYGASAFLESTWIINNSGFIFVPGIVTPFSFRIADMMADLIRPDFDDQWYSSYWQAALDDLAAASPNGEITHVQIRIWWNLPELPGEGTAEDWIDPHLGSRDGGQSPVMDNWKRWLFGYIEPGDSPLAYGPSAIERIRQAGLKFELAVSGAWENGDVVKPEPARYYYKEEDYPEWVALGGYDTFLDNYLNNVLLPVANFAKDYLEDGDIFCIAFEPVHVGADIVYLHNDKWVEVIQVVRQVFLDSGKNIYITLDHTGWWGSDYYLGYNAVKLLAPDAPLDPQWQGVSGATYLSELDFISVSWWVKQIFVDQVPDVWTDDDIPWLVNSWYHYQIEPKVGTGYGGIPAVYDRDLIADIRALSQVMNGTKVLLNTGYWNAHGRIAWKGGPYETDAMEQRVAWASQVRAVAGDPRSNYTEWCAGQDFERYARDKAAQPDWVDDSWRNSPAQDAIIEEIQAILTGP
jgi:hypothetical protein